MRTGLLAARQSTPLATRSLASDLVLRCCSSSAAAQLPWYKLLFEKKGLREGAGARTGWPSTWLLFPHGLSTARAWDTLTPWGSYGGLVLPARTS